MELNEFISHRRKELGLSLTQLASAINYTPQAISRIEKGIVSVSLTLVVPLSRTLKVSIKSFINSDINSIEPYKEKGEFDNIAFCTYLNKIIKEKDITQSSVVNATGINRNKFSKITRGESLPTIQEFKKLAEYFNVGYEELFFGYIPVQETPKKRINLFSSIDNPKQRKAVFALVFISIFCTIASITSGIILTQFPSTQETNNPPDVYDYENDKNYLKVTYYYDLLDKTEIEYVYKEECAPRLNFRHHGYSLTDYYLNNQVFDFNTPIINDIVLVGKLEKKTFTVNFYNMDNTLCKRESVKYLNEATPPQVEQKEGYKFLRWNSEEYKSVQCNLDIYPIYVPLDVKIIFDLDGGAFETNYPNYIDHFKYSDLNNLPKIIKKGFSFTQFYYFDEPFTEDTILRSVMTLTAHYNPNQYHIYFSDDMFDTLTVNYLEDVKLESVTKDGSKIVSTFYLEDSLDEISKQFVYKYDHDITLIPSYLTSSADYHVENGEVVLDCSPSDEEILKIPSEIGGIRVGKISSGFASGNTNLKMILINSSDIEIEQNAFKNLPALTTIDFSSCTKESMFSTNIFSNCPNIKKFKAGDPTKKSNYGQMTLKDYGFENSNELEIEFSNNVKTLPNGFNEGFGKIKKIKLNQYINKITLDTFDYATIDLEYLETVIPFAQFAYAAYEGTNTHINKVSLLEGADFWISGRGVTIDEVTLNSNFVFTLSGNLYAQTINFGSSLNLYSSGHMYCYTHDIYAKTINFKMNVNFYIENDVGLFHPYDDSELNINFYGRDSIPDEFRGISWLADASRTNINFI